MELRCAMAATYRDESMTGVGAGRSSGQNRPRLTWVQARIKKARRLSQAF